jgi:hypothetical protein
MLGHNDYRFVPKEKMSDPDDAKWYIHLKQEDYKTGKIYGEYWSLPILNIIFKDGNTLYKYIDEWINEYREIEKKCNHNYFFRGIYTYNALESKEWSLRIKAIFKSYTGIAVSPNSLRHMHVTHERRIGATPEELKASAYARHHSLEMAEKVYNEQTKQEILAPYESLTKKMLEGIIKK